MGPKVVKNDVSKGVPRPIGVRKQVASGRFEPSWTTALIFFLEGIHFGPM